jgi:hypothetical protein
MSRPSKQQLEIALAEAERLRDLDEDRTHMAQSLLFLHRRDEVLEHLLEAVEHYLNSGHGQIEHARLIKAVDAARHQLWEESAAHDPDFGLE